jgi:hypothetical protein
VQFLEEFIVYGIDTLGTRCILGLPLIAAGASGFGVVKDLYSGFNLQVWSISIELAVFWMYSTFAKSMNNKYASETV